MQRCKVFEQINGRKRMLLLTVSMTCSIASTLFDGQVDMLFRHYGNALLYLLGGFTGIFFLILCCMTLENTNIVRRVFVFLGENTILIVFFHHRPGYMITETFYYKLFGVVYGENVLSGNLEGFIHAATILLFLLPVIMLITRFFPWAVGKKKLARPSAN